MFKTLRETNVCVLILNFQTMNSICFFAKGTMQTVIQLHHLFLVTDVAGLQVHRLFPSLYRLTVHTKVIIVKKKDTFQLFLFCISDVTVQPHRLVSLTLIMTHTFLHQLTRQQHCGVIWKIIHVTFQTKQTNCCLDFSAL